MKKILLVVSILALVASVFAYMPRTFSQMLAIDGLDIMDYVDVFDNVVAGQPEFKVVVTDDTNGGPPISTETNTGNIVRVVLAQGPAGNAAWLKFDIQGFETGGTAPAGTQFTATITYLGEAGALRTDPISVSKTFTMPEGYEPIYYWEGDDLWTLPAEMFPQDDPEFALTVNSNYPGAAIWKDGVDTAQVTPYTFDPAEAGIYTLVMPNVSWNPVDYEYTAEEDGAIVFNGTFTPEVAVNPVPADGTTLTWAAPQTLELTWDPVADVDHYNVYWNGAAEAVEVTVPAFTTPEIGAGTYTWQVVPYIVDPAMPGKAARRGAPVATRVNNSASIKGGAVGAPVWGFTVEIAVPPVPVLTITSDPTGAALFLDAVDTGLVTPQDVTDAGTYTVEMANYTWLPAEFEWDGLEDDEVAFIGEEVIVVPPTLTITSIPAGAEIWLDGADTGLLTPNTVTDAGTYTVYKLGYTFAPAQYVWDGLADASVEFAVSGTQSLTITSEPTEARIFLNGVATLFLTPSTVTEHGVYTVQTEPYLPYIWTPEEFVWDGQQRANIHFVGVLPQDEFTLTVTSVPTGTPIFKDGLDTGQVTPHVFTNEAGTYTVYREYYIWTPELFVWDGLTDDEVRFVGTDTLPVELSSFNAVLTAQKFVQLTWISESESNMMGYRVYRNETQDASNASLITPVMIPATNTSSTQVYNLTDREVLGGTTYYYWLEAADYGHSIMYGPQYVEVTVDSTPELPVQTAMKNAYPNPFKVNSNTNIDVSVKAGEQGTITIFNVLGQVVQTYRVGEGTHNLKWNGKDTRGNACGSGIYFYKLSTPSMNQTKKMVIVK